MKQLFLLLLVFVSATGSAQTSKTVKLKATSGKTQLRHFSISGVVDDRSDTSNIGMMRAGLLNKQTPVTLANGTTGAISDFVQTYVQQDADKDPIELHILQLKVAEQVIGGKEQADLNTQFGFFKNGKKIIDYSGTSYIQSGIDVSPYIGKLVSQSLESVLREFDRWWSENKAKYDDSQKDNITVNATLQQDSKDPDHIAFRSNVPLHIEDFQADPDELSMALAATYSGFALVYETKSENTGTTVRIEVLPYFDKTKSWMRNNGKTAYVLQHEQQHFNITAIKAYEFIAAIRNSRFTVAGFKEEITALQKKYSKEMEQMQTQYDLETKHGTLKEKQKLWESRITGELNTLLTTIAN